MYQPFCGPFTKHKYQCYQQSTFKCLTVASVYPWLCCESHSKPSGCNMCIWVCVCVCVRTAAGCRPLFFVTRACRQWRKKVTKKKSVRNCCDHNTKQKNCTQEMNTYHTVIRISIPDTMEPTAIF